VRLPKDWLFFSHQTIPLIEGIGPHMSTNASSAVSLIHHAAEGTQTIPLEPGTYRVGTGSDCALILDDPSVSEAHCEIEVIGDRVVVRDLGSAFGTSIDGVPIQEDVLRPGQRLQVGTVEFSYAVRPAQAVRAVKPVSAAAAATTVPMARRSSGPRKLPEDAGFGAQLSEAFAYPFRRDGLILLICGTIVFGLLEAAQLVLSTLRFAGLIGVAYLIVLAMSGGYLFAFMQAVITSSAQGETDMPPWPEVSDFLGDILGHSSD
jgi:pSer/pThr/pTyr-binding forkhead associated (FHA) protein